MVKQICIKIVLILITLVLTYLEIFVSYIPSLIYRKELMEFLPFPIEVLWLFLLLFNGLIVFNFELFVKSKILKYYTIVVIITFLIGVILYSTSIDKSFIIPISLLFLLFATEHREKIVKEWTPI